MCVIGIQSSVSEKEKKHSNDTENLENKEKKLIFSVHIAIERLLFFTTSLGVDFTICFPFYFSLLLHTVMVGDDCTESVQLKSRSKCVCVCDWGFFN